MHSFRPLTGIMVLIISEYALDDTGMPFSFRPLTGIMVLIVTGFTK